MFQPRRAAICLTEHPAGTTLQGIRNEHAASARKNMGGVSQRHVSPTLSCEVKIRKAAGETPAPQNAPANVLPV
jgi:hypothetical protein